MQSSIIKHLVLAAESGDAAAQFNLGILCDSRLDDNGYAVEGNRAEAMKWLLAAAEQGLPRAQSRLAEMYAEGPGTPGDYIHACAWFLLAMTSLRGIHRHGARSGYDRISSYLTPAQLAKAGRLASNWKHNRQQKAANLSSPELALVEQQAL
jgi:Sel1 repeat